MKNKFEVFAVVAFAAIGIILLAGCKSPVAKNSVGKQPVNGTNFKIVAEYKPLHLYIYADVASTNKFPDFFVREGNDPIYIRANESNKVIITHLEKGLEVFQTHYDNNGKVLRRYVDFYYDDGESKYTYVDTDDDGLFDRFFKYNGHGKEPAVFVRSNLCWVPVVGKK